MVSSFVDATTSVAIPPLGDMHACHVATRRKILADDVVSLVSTLAEILHQSLTHGRVRVIGTTADETHHGWMVDDAITRKILTGVSYSPDDGQFKITSNLLDKYDNIDVDVACDDPVKAFLASRRRHWNERYSLSLSCVKAMPEWLGTEHWRNEGELCRVAYQYREDIYRRINASALQMAERIGHILLADIARSLSCSTKVKEDHDVSLRTPRPFGVKTEVFRNRFGSALNDLILVPERLFLTGITIDRSWPSNDDIDPILENVRKYDVEQTLCVYSMLVACFPISIIAYFVARHEKRAFERAAKFVLIHLRVRSTSLA